MKKRRGGIAAPAAAVFFSVVATLFFAIPVLSEGRAGSAAAPAAAVGQSGYLVPVGRTAGMKVFSKGVIVVETSAVETEGGPVSPGETAGLKAGDVIIKADGKDIRSVEDLQSAVEGAGGGAVSLLVVRNGKEVKLELTPAKDARGSLRIGAWVRDSMAGIGTITFYDPESGVFGALGHGICDGDTGTLIPLSSGCLIPSTVTGVRKGEAGRPGELIGAFESSRESGALLLNHETGLFGTILATELYPELFSGGAVPVAQKGEVTTGKAQILSNVEGGEVCAYDVEIVKILSTDKSTKNMQLRVTDEALLAKTGGIVQGMSGSPILQNGRLVGAVTHVLVGDPTSGYAIFIDNMLNTANSLPAAKKAA